MLNFKQARFLVQQEIDRMNESRSSDRKEVYEAIIINTATIEFDLGWVFFFDTKMYIETGDIRYAAMGNLPYIVDKQDGTLYQGPVTPNIEEYIEGFRRSKNKNA